MWNPPPHPDSSRLDEWFLGGGRAGSQRPHPVPFFPEVHEELTRSWKAPFTARNKSWSPPPPSPPSIVEPLWGTQASRWWSGQWPCNCVQQPPPLCGMICLPSRACLYLSGLTGSAYRACGEAASALHAMALLQVHQAKALKDLHKGGHDLEVLLELRAATDLVMEQLFVCYGGQQKGKAASKQSMAHWILDHLGLWSTKCALPAQVACSLH